MTDPALLPHLPRYPRSAYIDPPADIAKRTEAGARGWHAGWPDACPTVSARSRVTVTRELDGHEFSVSVDKRLANLYGNLLTMIQEVGYPLIGAKEVDLHGHKQGGLGSYVCRAIKGTVDPNKPGSGEPSNHSSATALDIWSRSNPMLIGRFADGSYGRAVPFVSTWHPLAVRLVAAADCYWGGWYWDELHRKTGEHWYCDAMHIEYMKRPQDVAASEAALNSEFEKIMDELYPEQPPEVPDVSKEDVMLLQSNINAMGYTPPLVVDGDFGPLTRAAVVSLPTEQTRRIVEAVAAARIDMKQDVIDAALAVPVTS